MKVLRLPRAKVQLGNPLPWNVRDDTGKLLLSKGFVVDTENQLNQLLERGAFVDVEEAKAYELSRLGTPAPLPQRMLVIPPNLFGQWDKTPEELRTLLSHLDNKPTFLAELDTFAHHILALLDTNLDVGIFRAVRQENQALFYYSYTHAIHTGVLGVLLGRHLKWSDERVMTLLKAALTMNTSIAELQGQMATQDFPIRDRQRAEILAHPQKTADLLMGLGVTDPEWLVAIRQHHEHPDGTGYPVQTSDISEMARALRVCDVLMAKITPRILRPAVSPQEAVRGLFREDTGGVMSSAIIKEFGIYPPGDYVKLASGELAVVVQRTDNAKAPIVAAITDTAGHPITKTLRRDTAQPAYAITGAHSDKALLKRLPPERLYGLSQAAPSAVGQ